MLFSYQFIIGRILPLEKEVWASFYAHRFWGLENLSEEGLRRTYRKPSWGNFVHVSTSSVHWRLRFNLGKTSHQLSAVLSQGLVIQNLKIRDSDDSEALDLRRSAVVIFLEFVASCYNWKFGPRGINIKKKLPRMSGFAIVTGYS